MTSPTRYRYRDLKPGDAYYDAWRKWYRLRVRSFVGFALVCTMAYFISWLDLPQGSIWSSVLIACFLGLSGWLAWLAIATWLWCCPRCKKLFNGVFIYYLHQSCHFCGLPKYAPDDPDKETADA